MTTPSIKKTKEKFGNPSKRCPDIRKILKIGLALSVQKINNVPVTKYDKKLDYIVTDKYIL